MGAVKSKALDIVTNIKAQDPGNNEKNKKMFIF